LVAPSGALTRPPRGCGLLAKNREEEKTKKDRNNKENKNKNQKNTKNSINNKKKNNYSVI
jgi:hypothetical protein